MNATLDMALLKNAGSGQDCRLLYYSAFPKARHGGGKRSRQVADLVLRGCPDVNHFRLNRGLVQALLGLVRFGLQGVVVALRMGLSLQGLLKFCTIRWQLANRVPSVAQAVVESDRGNGMLLALALAGQKIPYTLLPHNVEFLVPEQMLGTAFRTARHFQAAELLVARRASRVLTISEFDAAVFRCFGIPASVLRYWPTGDDLSRYRTVRQSRIGRRKSRKILCLGSVGNLPTRMSFEKILPGLAAVLASMEPEGYSLDVAGFGTESLRGGLSSANLCIHGAVTDAQLDRLLIDADAALIPVTQTSGYLTRLSELNAAGVPVLIYGDYIEAAVLDEPGLISLNEFGQISSALCALPDIAPAFRFSEDENPHAEFLLS